MSLDNWEYFFPFLCFIYGLGCSLEGTGSNASLYEAGEIGKATGFTCGQKMWDVTFLFFSFLF